MYSAIVIIYIVNVFTLAILTLYIVVCIVSGGVCHSCTGFKWHAQYQTKSGQTRACACAHCTQFVQTLICNPEDQNCWYQTF